MVSIFLYISAASGKASTALSMLFFTNQMQDRIRRTVGEVFDIVDLGIGELALGMKCCYLQGADKTHAF